MRAQAQLNVDTHPAARRRLGAEQHPLQLVRTGVQDSRGRCCYAIGGYYSGGGLVRIVRWRLGGRVLVQVLGGCRRRGVIGIDYAGDRRVGIVDSKLDSSRCVFRFVGYVVNRCITCSIDLSPAARPDHIDFIFAVDPCQIPGRRDSSPRHERVRHRKRSERSGHRRRRAADFGRR